MINKKHNNSRHTFAAMSNYFKIGKFVATFGLTGQIVLVHSLGKKTALKGLTTLFIEHKKDSFLPYFIENCEVKNENEVYVKVEGISTKEKAQTIVSREVWLLEADFKKFAEGNAPISLLGFNMINEDVDLGEIVEVIEQPHQVLCKIILNGNDALIPVNEEFLDKIDKKGRKVYLSLPDGLLDIYS